MSQKQKALAQRKMAGEARALQRKRDDDRAAFENERKRMLNELAGKMHTLLEDFARTHGYYLIIEAGTRIPLWS